MKFIVTTSDNYLHIIPVFCHLFNKYWGGPCEIVGYKQPDLPDNFTFHSMGEQGEQHEFSTDLRKYFEQQEQFFIWMMEDTFIKIPVDKEKLLLLEALTSHNVGRINLTNESSKQINKDYIKINGWQILENPPEANYRLSTQPSIWNRDFLLKYMTTGLTPWKFETQLTSDDYKIIGPKSDAPIIHNEGVRKFDIHKFDLNGMDEETLNEILEL